MADASCFLIVRLFIFVRYCLFFTDVSLLVPFYLLPFNVAPDFKVTARLYLCPMKKDIVLSKRVGLYSYLYGISKSFKIILSIASVIIISYCKITIRCYRIFNENVI